MKCKLCGKEKDTRRQMHGHLISKHHKEYLQTGYNLDELTDGAPIRAHEAEVKKYKRPALFRRLRSEDDAERLAIYDGYSYIDADGNIYTEAEAEAAGWI